MTRAEIIYIAREADCIDDQHYGTVWVNKLERFAALVAAEKDKQIAFLKDSHDVRADVQTPSLWLAISHAGKVKYTTDRERAAKWAASSAYRIVRDYYCLLTPHCKSVNAAADIRARGEK